MKMMHYVYCLLLVSSALLRADAQWAMLVYIETRDGLERSAIRNLGEMIRISKGDNARVFVQVNSTQNKGKRYIVADGKAYDMPFIDLVDNEHDNLLAAARWAFDMPTRHHAIVLSGHGHGPLSPTIGKDGEWEFEYDESFEKMAFAQQIGASLIKKDPKRAVLSIRSRKKYLSTDDLRNALTDIHKKILKGKHIAFVGLDLCLGAAIEHAYAIADSTDYLFACQNCEHHDGFDYAKMVIQMEHGELPASLLKQAALDYDAYYRQHEPHWLAHTVSVLDCRKAQAVAVTMRQFINSLAGYFNYRPQLKADLKELRRKSVSFCPLPVYTDLLSYFERMLELFEQGTNRNFDAVVAKRCKLTEHLEKLRDDVASMIVATGNGPAMADARGVSIYFPYAHIDSSYSHDAFGRDSHWIDFLSKLMR